MATPFGRYAALLVSLHGTGLFRRFTSWQQSVEAADRVEAYLGQEDAFQQHLIEQLRSDPRYAPHATDEVIDRNRQLVATWDTLSLMICMGVEQTQLEAVPTATSSTSLTLSAIDPTAFKLDPWPFAASLVTLEFEGRVLHEPFTEEAAMRAALQAAPWLTVSATLTPI